MKLIFLTVLVVLATSFEAKSIFPRQQQGLGDFINQIVSQLGLQDTWNNAGGNSLISQLLAESDIAESLTPDQFNTISGMFVNLLIQMANNPAQASVLVQQVAAQVQALIESFRPTQKRELLSIQDLFDLVEKVMTEQDLLHLFEQLQGQETTFVNQILAITNQVTQIEINDAQKQIFEQIVGQLAIDLKNGVNVNTAAQTAINSALDLIATIVPRKSRDFFDNIISQLGLSGIIAQIQSLGQNFLEQLFHEGLQTIALNGDQFKQVAAIFHQLAVDLKNPTRDPATIVQEAIKEAADLIESFKGFE